MSFIPIPNEDFEMMDAPVTEDDFCLVMNIPVIDNPGIPKVNISWNDCQDFITKLNDSQKKYIYRLPTEKEWELCCGKDPENIDEYGWRWDNSDRKLHPVKQKKPNAFGLYDMLGNVWEWCEDLYSETGSHRVVRGGSWYFDAQDLSSADRDFGNPEIRYDYVGFRLVRTSVALSSIILAPHELLKYSALSEIQEPILCRKCKLESIHLILGICFSCLEVALDQLTQLTGEKWR